MMKPAILAVTALLLAGATSAPLQAEPPALSLDYRDLALDRPEGRVELAARVTKSATDFCRRYWDAGNEGLYWDGDDASINPALANHRYCADTASILLAQRMPAAIRRAYFAGRRGQ